MKNIVLHSNLSPFARCVQPALLSLLVICSTSAFAGKCPPAPAGQRLTSVKLKIDHNKGDSVECAYGASQTTEIIPDRSIWNRGEGAEFLCTPATGNSCGFEVSNMGNPQTERQNLELALENARRRGNWEEIQKAEETLAYFMRLCNEGKVEMSQCIQ